MFLFYLFISGNEARAMRFLANTRTQTVTECIGGQTKPSIIKV